VSMTRRECVFLLGACVIATSLPPPQTTVINACDDPPNDDHRTPDLLRVQYHSSAWLPTAQLDARFYHYREDYRDCDVWRITCDHDDKHYGLECAVSYLERMHANFDIDTDTRAILVEMLDKSMRTHHRNWALPPYGHA